MSDEPRQRVLTQLSPFDILEWRSQFDGSTRRWVVHSVNLGGLSQESVVCIEALDRSPAWDEIALPLMWVPADLIRQQCRIAGRLETMPSEGPGR